MKALFAATAATTSGEFILTPEVIEENADFLVESAEAGILTVLDNAGQEIFPNHEGIYKPRDLEYSTNISAINGRCFLSWVTDESTNRKGARIYSGRDSISVARYLSLALEYARKSAKIREEEALEEAELARKSSYYETLPSTLCGFDRVGWCFYDEKGFLVKKIPDQAVEEAWSVEKLTHFLKYGNSIVIDLKGLYGETAKLSLLPEYEKAAVSAAGVGNDVILTGAAPVWLYLRIAFAISGVCRTIGYDSPVTGGVPIYRGED